MCYLSWAASCHSDIPFPADHLRTAGQCVCCSLWMCTLEQAVQFYYKKIVVHSYYTISMYAKPDPDLFLFSLYLCSSLDLGGFIQVYVRSESKPLLCQWNGSQELGWCAKQNTWLPGEMTWQELKQQTYRKCLLWNSRDLTVPLVFWNALTESCGVGAGCNFARTLGTVPLVLL